MVYYRNTEDLFNTKVLVFDKNHKQKHINELMSHLRLQARLLLLNVVDLDDQSLDLLLLLLNAARVLAADLLDLLGSGGGFSLVLGPPLHGLAVRLDQLPLEVQSSLGLFLELYAHGLEFNLNLWK